jgi:xanthine dehydrogenase accessory factor
MDLSTDIEVLRAAVDWLEQGSAVTLVTVVQTWGSAPRRPGALMVIHADGRFQGSVSGGCIEDDLVQRVLRGEFDGRPPQIIEYGINTATSRRVGLPCGGRLHLLVEHVDVATQLATVLASIDGRQRIARRVCLNTGEASLHIAADIETFTFDGDNLVKVFGPAWRMLIIGAGELARRVSQLALTLDYAVTLCDSRPEYASGWQVEGTEFSSRAPAQFVASFAPDEHTAVLALAHAPALEDEAIASALNSDAFYVGALGSRKNQRARIGRLHRMGVSKAQLARLHGPIGLDIGSHTPAEIAIAIIAHLIATRNRQSPVVPGVESVDG